MLPPGVRERKTRGKPSPPFVLGDGAFLQLPGDGAQHLAGVVGKVQVPNLGRRNRDDGERLLVLLHGGGADLKRKVAFVGRPLGPRGKTPNTLFMEHGEVQKAWSYLAVKIDWT